VADSVNLTIRIGEDVRAAVEKAALASGQTTTEFLLHAAKLRMAAACTGCGRDLSGPPTVLPGMTDCFARWCTTVTAERGTSPRVVLATNERDVRRVYTGTFDLECVHDTYVSLYMGKAKQLVPVPRAYLVMWEQQIAGDSLRSRLVRDGYIDMLNAFEQAAAGRNGVR